ncbi:MAG: hypothetical protein IKP24_02165 [Alphaproteobacteria bacterium]|nr:hypothetical protein [Alphaproteobacteria bacterium]
MADDKIYKFLNFLNDALVKKGCEITHMYFDLSFPEDIAYFNGEKEHKCGDDFASFQEQSEYTDEEIIETIKACKSYGFIKGSPYSQIWLTETGRDIVLERQQPKQQPAFTFNIQEMHGNNQVGSNNIQNITVDNAIKCLLEKIDASHVPESTKSEARGLLQRFMEHPIIAPLVSSVLASTLGIKSAL